jgi:uncharacterized protein (DUF1330 family)
MAKGYLIANIRVHDKEVFEKFKLMSTPLISEYGGKLLVRTPEVDRREGDVTGLVVMLEFPNIEMARTFYESESYTAAKLVREVGSSTDLCLVEGLE